MSIVRSFEEIYPAIMEQHYFLIQLFYFFQSSCGIQTIVSPCLFAVHVWSRCDGGQNKQMPFSGSKWQSASGRNYRGGPSLFSCSWRDLCFSLTGKLHIRYFGTNSISRSHGHINRTWNIICRNLLHFVIIVSMYHIDIFIYLMCFALLGYLWR